MRSPPGNLQDSWTDDMTQLWATSEYPHSSQDPNQAYPNSHSQVGLPHYSHEGTFNYLHPDGQPRYPAIPPSYPSFSPTYMPPQNTNTYVCIPPFSAMPMHYQTIPPPNSTVPSQHRPPSSFCHIGTQAYRSMHPQLGLGGSPEIVLAETEEQDSPNAATMRSEPIEPPMEGYPLVEEFDELIRGYVENLSPKKQDKALIHASRAANIKAVLVDKKTTSVESAQFRFWVKKMFSLEPGLPGVPVRQKKICHEGKPVAIREKLFKILTRAHKQCQHGGRDKTSAQVRRVYSWVPKELISRFVKLCPTCRVRRGTSRTSPSVSDHSMGHFVDPQSPGLSSSSQSRRNSAATGGALAKHSPNMSRVFFPENRWLADRDKLRKTEAKRGNQLETAAPTMNEVGMTNAMAFSTFSTVPAKRSNETEASHMSDDMLHHDDMSGQYHLHTGSMQNLYGLPHATQHYRVKRESMLKQEPRY